MASEKWSICPHSGEGACEAEDGTLLTEEDIAAFRDGLIASRDDMRARDTTAGLLAATCYADVLKRFDALVGR